MRGQVEETQWSIGLHDLLLFGILIQEVSVSEK
jgi:hypothetical protein